MKAMQRRTYAFDTRSVMLFAALSLGGTAALHAQTTPSSPQFGPAEKTAPPSGSRFSMGPTESPGTQAPPMSSAQLFERADTNQDSKLSVQEAARLPAIAQRFSQLDSDKDGSLSRSEFEKGTSS
jgi:hypothetical protein